MFFTGRSSQATGSIADNGTLVRKVAFPRLILPLAAVTSQFVQFLLMFTAIVPVALLWRIGPVRSAARARAGLRAAARVHGRASAC